MEFRNGILLQLFECIESTQNEVKRKMIETEASNDAPKSLRDVARQEKVCVTVARHLSVFCECVICQPTFPRQRIAGMPAC
jgi:hypothetical protein